MIHASQIASISTAKRIDATAAIEAHIDAAITHHAEAGHAWPLAIPTTRAGWSPADIETVLARYRAAGWTAQPGGNRAMAVLSPASAP